MNLEQKRKKDRDYRVAHKSEIATYRMRYKASHGEKVRATNAAYRASHREIIRAKAAIEGRGLKMAALNAYGGARCACCGETLFEGLTIDHMNGDGSKRRKQDGGRGIGIYRRLKRMGYPIGFQVLCGTCNLAKGTGDHCPHKDGLDEEIDPPMNPGVCR